MGETAVPQRFIVNTQHGLRRRASVKTTAQNRIVKCGLVLRLTKFVGPLGPHYPQLKMDIDTADTLLTEMDSCSISISNRTP